MPVSRNAVCPCGSRKKYKHCCMPQAKGSGGGWRPAFWALFGLLVILYALAFRTYYIGYFNDDASYLIGAKSLLTGRYADLSAPGEPPLIQ